VFARFTRIVVRGIRDIERRISAYNFATLFTFPAFLIKTRWEKGDEVLRNKSRKQ
jgi:hypothetical protein